MPKARPHASLYTACREQDAEKAGYALLLIVAEDMKALDEAGGDDGPYDLPRWAVGLIGHLLSITKARVQYRSSQDGQHPPMSPADTPTDDTPEAMAVLRFVESKQ
tara:strand:- start:3531 stop:3848 length:318 start_codon:yes stop_codon:yes gene_type:complete